MLAYKFTEDVVEFYIREIQRLVVSGSFSWRAGTVGTERFHFRG
jgi:hypothetical protein